MLCEFSTVKEAALKKRKVIKGEKHHWWPKGLSKYWENERGLVQRIDIKGEVIPPSQKNLDRYLTAIIYCSRMKALGNQL